MVDLARCSDKATLADAGDNAAPAVWITHAAVQNALQSASLSLPSSLPWSAELSRRIVSANFIFPLKLSLRTMS
jgi:hypothetical protein